MTKLIFMGDRVYNRGIFNPSFCIGIGAKKSYTVLSVVVWDEIDRKDNYTLVDKLRLHDSRNILGTSTEAQ